MRLKKNQTSKKDNSVGLVNSSRSIKLILNIFVEKWREQKFIKSSLRNWKTTFQSAVSAGCFYHRIFNSTVLSFIWSMILLRMKQNLLHHDFHPSFFMTSFLQAYFFKCIYKYSFEECHLINLIFFCSHLDLHWCDCLLSILSLERKNKIICFQVQDNNIRVIALYSSQHWECMFRKRSQFFTHLHKTQPILTKLDTKNYIF